MLLYPPEEPDEDEEEEEQSPQINNSFKNERPVNETGFVLQAPSQLTTITEPDSAEFRALRGLQTEHSPMNGNTFNMNTSEERDGSFMLTDKQGKERASTNRPKK